MALSNKQHDVVELLEIRNNQVASESMEISITQGTSELDTLIPMEFIDDTTIAIAHVYCSLLIIINSILMYCRAHWKCIILLMVAGHL